MFICIYKTHLENKFKDYYINTFPIISSQYIQVLCKFYDEINKIKNNNNIIFNLDDIEQILFNILKINCKIDIDNRNIFDKMLTRYYFYNICRLTYDNLYNDIDKLKIKQVMCSSYNKIFKKVKISVEDVFEKDEFLDGKLSDCIFTHIDTNNNGNINEDKFFEYNKKEFFKDFINKKLKEFNILNNNNIYQELIINENDYELIQKILFFCENNIKNKKVIILLEGNKLFKELIFKFCSFISGNKVIECKRDINSIIHLNNIFEEIVINNKKIIYYIKENILLKDENSFYSIHNLLIPERFMSNINLNNFNKGKEIDINKALNLINNNLKIALDIENYINNKEINDYFEKNNFLIVKNSHIIYQSKWKKNDYQYYFDYYFSKSKMLKEIDSSTKQNIFDIIYNTFLFSSELINKIDDNIKISDLLNNFTDSIQIYLNKYEINYNIVKEKYLTFENCNPTDKIKNLIEKINEEIKELNSKKVELDKKENDLKKRRQKIFVEIQNYNKQINEYEKEINDNDIKLLKITDELDNIIEPITKEITIAAEDCLSYNDFSLNDVKHSYENSNVGKLLLISIFKLVSDNSNEISNSLWELTKRNLNMKMLNNFFNKKFYINNANEKSYTKILENIINNNEFKEININLNNEKYSKPPFISIKKFSKYFINCFILHKNKNQINKLNKKISEIKNEKDNLKNLEKEEKKKINENKSKNMDIENELISVEKGKNNIIFNIKCHNDLRNNSQMFLEKLEDIIPELLKNKKIFQTILSDFIYYHLLICLYYAFAPILEQKNRILLQKYIYGQINKINKNEIKEFTFLEIFYYFLDIVNKDNDVINNNKVKPTSISSYIKNKNLILSLYKYLDLNNLNINNENNFIVENIIFIDFYQNSSINLLNNKNPGFSNLILINLFKGNLQKVSKENLNENNKDKINKKNEINKINNINNNVNISNDIIISNENHIYHLIEINLNEIQIEKDLEFISKIINEGYNSRNKKYLIFFINNCNENNIYYFDELINNSDNKIRPVNFYIGKNKISLNNQIHIRVFFCYKELDYNFSLNPNVYKTKLINFNVKSKIFQKELEFYLGNISDMNNLDCLKENQLKLISFRLEKEKFNKKVCDIISKYEYQTTENNYIHNKKLLTDIELEIKNFKNKKHILNIVNKNIQLIKTNLEYLNIICSQGGKIYKLIQNYLKSFSFKEFQILIEKFFYDYGFNEIIKERSNDNSIEENNSSDYNEEHEDEEQSYNKDENDTLVDEHFSQIKKNEHSKIYTKDDLTKLLNYFYDIKIKNIISSNNIKIVNYLKISLYLYYLKENNKDNKMNNEFYGKILSCLNNLLSNSIKVESIAISPVKNISNENWNKLIYLSNDNIYAYSNIIDDISENKLEWEKSLSNSSNEDICNKIIKILKNDDNSSQDKILDILILISFICPFRFSGIKEYLMKDLYKDDENSLKNHYSLKQFITSLENSFNISQKPLILIEKNNQNLEQKIQYIKNILYPKLLAVIKNSKGISSKNPVTKVSSNNLIILNTNHEKNIQNNNIMTFEKGENSIKFMIIKDTYKSSYYDNIIQLIKTGGLLIIENISKFDKSFIEQILNLIYDAKINKSLDKTFRLIFTIDRPLINDDLNEILLKNCVYFNIDLYNDISNSNFKNKILESIKNLNQDLILFFSPNIFRKKILVNFIFLNSLLKEISENIFYFNVSEIEDILLFVKKYIESNESDYKMNNNNLGNNYYFLIQIIIDYFFISKFLFNEEQFRIKNFLIKLIFDENYFIKENKYLLFFNNGKFIIENNNNEINLLKLFNLFNNIPEYEFNNIILIINRLILEYKQNIEINSFFKAIKYEDLQTISNTKTNDNIKYLSNEEISNKFKKFLSNMPEDIILPLDDDINDDNISKNLFKIEKNGMFINPLDELLIEEVTSLNNLKNEYKNKLVQLNDNLNKSKFINEELFEKIITENDIENNINYINEKYNFYKEWLKEGELKKYFFKYINNIKLFLYLLKFKHYKKEISLLNKYEKNIESKTLDKIYINFSLKNSSDNSIEITGLSFNLNDKYELLLVDNHLTLSKKKDNNNLIGNKPISLFIEFIYEDENKNKDLIFNNNKTVIGKANLDLPLIKEQLNNDLDYDTKIFSCNLYQYINDSFIQVNDSRDLININFSNELDLDDMNEIILNGILIYVNSSHQFNINQ